MRNFTQNAGNILTIQHQTCADEIFRCTIFVGYGGVIFFDRCATLREICFCREQENFFAIHSPPKHKMLDKCLVEKHIKMRVHEVF